MKNDVIKGNFSIVMISPEMLVGKYRSLLTSPIYKRRLVGLIVDEAHCVVKWGDTFREVFIKIGNVRCLLEPHVNVMALTATATSTLRKKVERSLGMSDPVLIVKSPDKSNIRFSCLETKKKMHRALFSAILDEIRLMRTNLPRIIIYCKNKTHCGELYTLFETSLGDQFTEPIGASHRIAEARMVDMFFTGTHPSVKNTIIENFTKPSPLRIVISTIAFGMGVDTPDVRLVVHLGASNDIESYVQEVGRVGRDGDTSYAILFHSSKLLANCSENMISYARNDRKCRRDLLFRDFDMYDRSEENIGCLCCDVCLKSCECDQCETSLKHHYSFLPKFFGL